MNIDGVPINQGNQSKSLELIIDQNLLWKAHIHEISKKVPYGIGALKRVRPFVSMHTAITIYKGLTSSHTLIIVALYGMASPNSLVRNSKNFKIVLSELSSYDISSRFLLN